jgi:hypothetical protein
MIVTHISQILQAKHTNFAGGELLRYPPNNEILPRVVKDSVTKNLRKAAIRVVSLCQWIIIIN